ncbi:2OG-Fe(II) oxygenase [uncultured Cyclobacterium sp.]|uniref:2OG-Fe(II) oxygenase n=1 Tax=uncultured Cyclobacterium sp. TaxID=453820 RepID=UPI0030EBBA81|tara:strand:- start:53668 stop:54288 length:621 start_codon:yes stop_codon:yes gene_type:complete
MDDRDKNNDKVVQDLYEKGWSVVDNYISEAFRKDLLCEQKELLMHGQFRLAGIGSGETFAIKPEIRSDKVLWMDENLLTPIQEVYWNKMDRLKSAINQRCFLGLKSFEAHFAMYPQGSFYLRHLDQFQSVQYRIVSVILYLNDTWEESDGGELRMYFTRPDGIEEYQDFFPVGGRLVVFLSGEIPHEVLPTAKERISITGWMKDRD